MKKLLAMVLLIMVSGCSGVSQEEFDRVQAELSTAQAEIETFEQQASEMESELENLERDLVEAQHQTDEAEIRVESLEKKVTRLEQELESAIQRAEEAEATDIERLHTQMSSAKAQAEILEAFFTAAMAGEDEEVDRVALMSQLQAQVDAAEDEVLREKFQALISSGGGEEETEAFFLYLFRTLPDLLEE